MIIELPGFVDTSLTSKIREAVKGHKPKFGHHAFNRDGKTVAITHVPELKEIDDKLSEIFQRVQQTIVRQRYKPIYPSADTGYEYHLYRPGDVCHHHADSEFSAPADDGSMLRYASVVLHLNTVNNGRSEEHTSELQSH